jgi:hypothetical protein
MITKFVSLLLNSGKARCTNCKVIKENHGKFKNLSKYAKSIYKNRESIAYIGEMQNETLRSIPLEYILKNLNSRKIVKEFFQSTGNN